MVAWLTWFWFVCCPASLAMESELGESQASPSESVDESPPKVQPALTVGAMELFGLASPPPHLGFFLMASLDLLIPLDDKWTFIVSNGLEFAPDNQNWGGFSFLILDRVIAESGSTVFTIEPQVGVVHNAVPLDAGGFAHALYPSAGVGVAIIGEKHTWIPTITTSIGLQGEGLSQGLILYYSKAF